MADFRHLHFNKCVAQGHVQICVSLTMVSMHKEHKSV